MESQTEIEGRDSEVQKLKSRIKSLECKIYENENEKIALNDKIESWTKKVTTLSIFGVKVICLAFRSSMT